MRSLSSFFVLAWLSGLGFGCSPSIQKETEHVEASRALEKRLGQLEASQISGQVLEAGAKLLSEKKGQWFRFGDQAISRLEISSFQHWNDAQRYAQEDGEIQTAFKAIEAYDKALDERGVRLVVVLIPQRLTTDPSVLPGVELPSRFTSSNPGFVRFLLDLNRAGVDAVDLGPAFAKARGAKKEDEIYFAYDCHWTPRGAAIAAKVVEEHLLKEVGVKAGKDKRGRDFVLKREQAEYLVPPAMPALLPVAEDPVLLRFDRVLRSDGTPALEQDRKSPVLLLGDSFTCYYRDEAADFGSRLQAGLRRKLDTIAMRGGAGKTVWKNIRRRKDELAGKQVVVWVLTSRLITSGEVQPVDVFPK